MLCIACVEHGTPTKRSVRGEDIAGTYVYEKNGGGRVALTVRADGHYVQQITTSNGGTPRVVRGEWTVDNGALFLDGLWISSLRDPERPEDPPTDPFIVADGPGGAFDLYGGDESDVDYYRRLPRQPEALGEDSLTQK